MPNLMSDRDLALSNGDATTCEYCGAFEWVGVGPGGHVCEGMLEAARKRAQDFKDGYEGDGQKVTKRIVIEVTAYNTEMAFRSAITDFDLFFDENSQREQTHEDSIAGFNWTAKMEVKDE